MLPEPGVATNWHTAASSGVMTFLALLLATTGKRMSGFAMLGQFLLATACQGAR
jgi:hypothetical protein